VQFIINQSITTKWKNRVQKPALETAVCRLLVKRGERDRGKLSRMSGASPASISRILRKARAGTPIKKMGRRSPSNLLKKGF